MRILILYGSQTGTAQDVAEQLWRMSRYWGCQGPVLAFDDYPIERLTEERCAIFVVATTGDGQAPDNMLTSWRYLLRRSLPSNLLDNLKFACIGLGDSSYQKFNYAAKKLFKRLQQLGGVSITPLALADDQHEHGFGAVALPWMENIETLLKVPTQINSVYGVNSIKEEQLFKWRSETNPMTNKDEINNLEVEHLLWPHRTVSHKIRLLSNQRTTDPEHFQEVRLLQFETKEADLFWEPGDVLLVQPSNSPNKIKSFLSLIEEHKWNFNKDTAVQIYSNHPEMILPLCYSRPLTVLQMVTYIWDLNAQPRQRVFELLALNCDNELEKEKLVEFTKMEGLDNLINYINRPRRTILEVLHDFPNATSKLTLNVLIEMFSIIQPRSFSIASCKESGSLDLLVAVVRYKTKLSTERIGTCSNWLKELPANQQINASIKRGTMQFPIDRNIPLIMIGPGTGIAPFRSIIQYRIMNGIVPNEENTDSTLYVFFGCRNRSNDFHFQEDLELWHQKHYIELYTAFSRDQDHKIYVQHLIHKYANELKNLIQNLNAYIFIAGSSKNMPKAVKETFIEVLNDENYIELMIKNKRYQEETWS